MHHIRLTSDIPVKVKTIPIHYAEKVEAEIKELEQQKSHTKIIIKLFIINGYEKERRDKQNLHRQQET